MPGEYNTLTESTSSSIGLKESSIEGLGYHGLDRLVFSFHLDVKIKNLKTLNLINPYNLNPDLENKTPKPKTLKAKTLNPISPKPRNPYRSL